MSRRRKRAKDPMQAWVFDAADSIIEGGDLPGEHIVGVIVRLLKKDLDPVGEKRFRHPIKLQLMREDLAAAIARNRRKGVKAPITKAREEVAKRWGRNSGQALRKALQPTRAKPQPRRRRS